MLNYQQCRLQLLDHYSNIASLNNAPDRVTYNEQVVHKCEGRISVQRLETAETEDISPAYLERLADTIDEVEGGIE